MGVDKSIDKSKEIGKVILIIFFVVVILLVIFDDEGIEESTNVEHTQNKDIRTLEPIQTDEIQTLEKITEDYHSTHTYIGNSVFDCDNMASEVWNIVTTAGFNAYIVAGNTEVSDVEIENMNHAWVIVDINEGSIALEATESRLVYASENPNYYHGWFFDSPKEWRDFLRLMREYETQVNEFERAVEQYESQLKDTEEAINEYDDLVEKFNEASYLEQLKMYNEVFLAANRASQEATALEVAAAQVEQESEDIINIGEEIEYLFK